MKNFFKILKLVMKYGRAAMAAVDAFVSELERSGVVIEDEPKRVVEAALSDE